MTRENAIKVYNKLEVQLFELDNFFHNTGTMAEYEAEVREFLAAGRRLERLVEKKFYDDGKAI